MPDIIVIGGGAAGFFGAIAAAEAAPGKKVLLLEKGRELLGKVRISGGGRCNVTHACFEPSRLVENYPRGGRALRGPLSRFQPRDTVEWFTSRGVPLKTEEDGRMFPVSDRSASIVDCLLAQARRGGVEVRPETSVETIRREGTGFLLILKDGSTLSCGRLLLATGSNRQGHAWAQALGHNVVPPVPSLFTFNVSDIRLHGLAGVSVPRAGLRLEGLRLEQAGPLLITHWGLSGPAVLKLSAWGARALFDKEYKAPLRVNWLGNVARDRAKQTLLEAKTAQARKAVASSPCFGLPQRLWVKLAAAAGISEWLRWAELTGKALDGLAEEVTEGLYRVDGKGEFKEEFVTCGGVDLDEVDFKTMESKICPGLHFAGEILDIDGVTGGFNFQSAWTTGWLAGKALAF